MDDLLDLVVERLGLVEYDPTWRAMRELTLARKPESPDQIWLLQHPPVYTAGIAAREAHFPRSANGIPVVRIDRGGQITYHGPGQLVAYAMVDLRRLRIGVREFVRRLEAAVIDCLSSYGIAGERRPGAPGVYVSGAKIAALGLRIRNGYSYHGLALNVDMDLSPFAEIDPCGYPGLAVTQLADLGVRTTVAEAAERMAGTLGHHLARAAA